MEEGAGKRCWEYGIAVVLSVLRREGKLRRGESSRHKKDDGGWEGEVGQGSFPSMFLFCFVLFCSVCPLSCSSLAVHFSSSTPSSFSSSVIESFYPCKFPSLKCILYIQYKRINDNAKGCILITHAVIKITERKTNLSLLKR